MDGGYNVRIFTADVEVPFAGHPTLGTAFVIRQFLQKDKTEDVFLNLSVGQIPVAFVDDDQGEFWMEQNQPVFNEIIQPQVITEILHINEENIDTQYPIQIVSTGLPAIIVPVKTLDEVKKCLVNHNAWQQFLEKTDKMGLLSLLVFTPETIKKENNLHARVFVGDTGFFEDSATGSANGNLAAYL